MKRKLKYVYVMIRVDYIEGNEVYRDILDCYSKSKYADTELCKMHDMYKRIQLNRQEATVERREDSVKISYPRHDDGRIFTTMLKVERRRLDWID